MRMVVLVVVLSACGSPCTDRRAPISNVSSGLHTADAIAKLDTVSGHFFELEKQPAIATLLAADREAVEPLIEVLEHDQRTSRVEYD
ncbi:MAG TPA: hypothetical protein VGO00_23560, partial [Kofleriaceae bacterium]|nr:hypothetical protein [Kofleriaceae bacterium]